jgi:apolipoprotein N-acyltransferase
MKLQSLTRFLPAWKNAALVILSAVLLILAFPDFEFWPLAWFGLVPLLWAIEREKESAVCSFLLGWIWGLVFFTGTCWWLTFAPITYAEFPWVLAYFLLLIATGIVGIFPGIFAVIFSILVKRFGNIAIIAAPFVWVLSEFLRYHLTGNNWNSVGYAWAFVPGLIKMASFGGVYVVTFQIVAIAAIAKWFQSENYGGGQISKLRLSAVLVFAAIVIFGDKFLVDRPSQSLSPSAGKATFVAIQPNVPMSGLTYERWQQLRAKHVALAETALAESKQNPKSAIRDPQSTTVVFPESPMNFMYEDDEEFRAFVHAFAAKHDVQVLFNSAEPDGPNDKYFNSAVLVGPDGKELAQYDKIYLVPFGESVPAPLQSIVPALVGSFSYGKEFDLLPLGDAKAGVMICFESHFGELSREYVRNGADAIIEMTNDGYLGPTPILKQHLANAVFRAVETNRPVLRVTNVGITAYITPKGEVIDPGEPYTEATRVWSVGRSDGSQTLYVRYGDWFAWLCSLVTIGLLGFAIWRRPETVPTAVAGA